MNYTPLSPAAFPLPTFSSHSKLKDDNSIDFKIIGIASVALGVTVAASVLYGVTGGVVASLATEFVGFIYTTSSSNNTKNKTYTVCLDALTVLVKDICSDHRYKKTDLASIRNLVDALIDLSKSAPSLNVRVLEAVHALKKYVERYQTWLKLTTLLEFLTTEKPVNYPGYLTHLKLLITVLETGERFEALHQKDTRFIRKVFLGLRLLPKSAIKVEAINTFSRYIAENQLLSGSRR